MINDYTGNKWTGLVWKLILKETCFYIDKFRGWFGILLQDGVIERIVGMDLSVCFWPSEISMGSDGRFVSTPVPQPTDPCKGYKHQSPTFSDFFTSTFALFPLIPEAPFSLSCFTFFS